MIDFSNSKNILYNSPIYTNGDVHIGDTYHIQGVIQKIPLELNTLPYIAKENVIGRDNDLAQVKTILQSSDRVVLVNGIGGIGKTTLAKYFTAQFRKEYNYIAWVNSTSNIKEAFTNDIVLIDSLHLRAELESLPKNEKWIDQSFSLILNRMRQLGGNNSEQKNLLIIDNAGEDIEHIQILDQIALRPNWKVLVTSREKLLGFTEYELGFLSKEDAKRLFYLHYQREVADKLVAEILELLDYHTLLIEVVSKTAQSLRWSLPELVDHLKKKGLNISEEAKIKFPHNYNQKVWNVFEYLLEMFSLSELSDYEQWVMMQFSVLPSIPIAYEGQEGENILAFLQIEKGVSKDRFTQAINRIVEKGWLLWDKREDRFKMHQMLQEVLQFKLNPTIEDCEKIITGITTNLELANNIINYENTTNLGTYLTSYFYKKYKKNTLVVTETNIFLPTYTDFWERLIISLCLILASTYDKLNRTKESIFELRKGIYWAKPLPHSQFRMVMLNNQLAMQYKDLADFDGDTNLLKEAEKAINISINLMNVMSDGFTNKELFYGHQASHFNNLGLIYEKMGKLDDAVKAIKKARHLLYKAKTRAPYLLGSFYNNLASVYLSQERIGLAYNNLKKALKHLKELILITDDKHSVKINLESTYRAMAYILIIKKEYIKAIEFINKSLVLVEEIYPDHHLLKAHSYNEIANYYFLMGKHESALSFIKKCLYIKKANPNEKSYHFNITENLGEAILEDMEQKNLDIYIRSNE